MRKTLMVLLLAIVLVCSFAVMAVPGSAAETVVTGIPDSFNYGFSWKGGGGWIGNNQSADLTGGKSFVMEFSMRDCELPLGNYNIGYLIGGEIPFAGNDPYTSGKSFFWHSNWAYYDLRHAVAGMGGIEEFKKLGAKFNENILFETNAIFTNGNDVRLVYTAYADETADSPAKNGSVRVYTKSTGAEESEWKLWAEISSLPKAASPDVSKAYVAWYLAGGVADNSTFTGTLDNFKMYVQDVDGSVVQEFDELILGPNFVYDDGTGSGGGEDDEPEEEVKPELIIVPTSSVTVGQYRTGKISNWFGSESGVNLEEGESLDMTFSINEGDYKHEDGKNNFDLGFVINTVGSDGVETGGKNPYSDDPSAFFFYGNQKSKTSAINGLSGDIVGNLIPSDVMKTGNTVKAVYTYSANGGSIEVFVKARDAVEFTSVAKVENIANAPSDNVHIYWHVSNAAYANTDRITANKFKFTRYAYSITTSDGQIPGEGFSSQRTKIETSKFEEVGHYKDIYVNNLEYAEAIKNEKLLVLSGHRDSSYEILNEGTENEEVVWTHKPGAITWFANVEMKTSDSFAFSVVAGESFKIVFADVRGETTANDLALVAETVDYKFYKVEFEAGKAYLMGSNVQDGDYAVVDEVEFNKNTFYIGIRLESETSKANTLYIDGVNIVAGGMDVDFTFKKGIPEGTSIFGTGAQYINNETYTVKFVTYDGGLVADVEVCYGCTAKLPDGEWLNAADAQKQATFVNSDRVIYLEVVGDNVGGILVTVDQGKILNPTKYGESYGVYQVGDEVTVVARDLGDRENYLGWSDGTKILTTDVEYTFNVKENVDLVAVFEKYVYNVSVENGYFMGASDTTVEIKAYDEITFVANEKEGYSFAGWSDGENIVSYLEEYTHVALDNLTLTATYTPIKYNVSLVNGHIKGSDLAFESIDYDEEVTIVADTDIPLEFVGWATEDDARYIFTEEAEYTFIHKGDVKYYAIFMEDPVLVKVENGIIDTAGQSLYVERGTELTIIADEAPVGEQFARWTDNIGNPSFSAVFTFNADYSATYVAMYEVAELAVEVENGSVYEEGRNEYIAHYGEEVTVYANTPEEGYVFAGWSNGRVIVSSDMEYTFTITTPVKLYATYAADLYKVTVEGGLVNGKTSADIAYLSKVNVVAMNPSYGMYFDGWFIDNVKVSSDTKYELTVTGNVTVVAQYAKLDYTLSVIGGEIKDSEDKLVELPYLSQITVVADAPATNYVFIGWSNGGSIVSRDREFTLILERDTVLTAKYAPAHFVVTVIDGTINNATSAYVELNSDATVVAKDKAGYQFKGWSNGLEMVSTDKTYTFKVKDTVTMTAVYEANMYTVTVNGGTLANGKTTDQVAYGEEVTVKYTGEKTFEGWYVGETKVSSEATYVFTMKGDVILTAKEGDGVAAGGCGCGSIAPTDKSNGGNMMIIGILALIVLAIVAMRHSKKLVKFAPKAMVAVLCVAIVAGAILVPGAIGKVPTANGADISAAGSSTGMNIVADGDECVYYFPVENYDFGSTVRVSFDIKLNAAPVSGSGRTYSTTKFLTAGDVFVDDALPLNSWTKLTYETKVIAANGGFNVMLKVKGATGLDMDIKNLTVDDNVLPETLLAGATMWMLPNTTSEQQMSFVIQTASGKLSLSTVV